MAATELEQRCNTLRSDLKLWEKKFAAAHDGRKAGRADIKANTEISQKYKEYNKLRDILAGKTGPQTPSKHTRSLAHNADRTPKAAKVQPNTPKRKIVEIGTDSIAPSPSQPFSEQRPAFIGPTPQRDGKVLGLFDLLPAETPSKSRAVFADIVPNILQTPSKQVEFKDVETTPEFKIRRERTPLSSGKRFMLDQFVTPKKRPRAEEGTPTSVVGGPVTPAFLRRDNFLADISEDHEPTPRPLPWQRKGMGRSLSAIIKSMRKQEEDKLDEEADIMRQMEMEELEMPAKKKQKLPEVHVHNSQATMPLGPDRGFESENEVQDPNSDVQKTWKKKGLKRQTRRVIMKPSFPKPKAVPMHTQGDATEEVDEIPETQPDADITGDGLDFSEDDGSEYASDASHSKKKAVARKTNKAAEASALQGKDNSNQKQDGPVKAAARKIKATAHANYRRLKIKSKGGNGGKGRFGRKR